MTGTQKEQISVLLQEGYDIGEIGEMIGIAKNTVKIYCWRNKLSKNSAYKETKNQDTPITPKKEQRSTCLNCGKSIVGRSRTKPRKFCCDQCRYIWWRTHTDESGNRSARLISCAYCGKEFDTHGNPKRRYCCHTPHLTTEQLEFAFVTAFNQMLEARDTYFEEYETIIELLTDTAELDAEAAKLNEEVVDVYELIKRGIQQNARIAQSQTEYSKSEAKLQKRYAAAKARLDEIAAEKHARTVRREKLNRFLDDLRRQENLLTEFDPAIFRATVDEITVHAEQDVVVTFREGTDIHVDIRGK